MKRTQIYITEEQDRKITRVAKDRKVPKAEAIRRILDAALEPSVGETEAQSIIRSTAGICSEYPDWPEWQRSVRGRTAAERLDGLNG